MRLIKQVCEGIEEGQLVCVGRGYHGPGAVSSAACEREEALLLLILHLTMGDTSGLGDNQRIKNWSYLWLISSVWKESL